MINFINKISNKILKRNLPISADMPISYLFGIIFDRIIMLIRGVIKGIFFYKKGFPLFVGKKTVIKVKSKITVGNCISIQDYVHINALSKEGIILCDNVSIGMRSIIKTSGSLTSIGKGFYMGHDSAMGNDCFVGAAGGVKIGCYVAIGQNVRFHSENHEFHDKSKMICEQGVTNQGIEVGDDVWIGAGAVILDGVKIGNGCVIGANTLVNKDIPDYSIAVGNPVRIIGERKIKLKVDEHIDLNAKKKFFSIIIPVYNVERYLQKCLDSVIRQDFENYEIIIINDGSSDKSKDIIEKFYQENIDKCKVIHKKNEGLSMARNDGIKESDGKYLIFLDSDDWIGHKSTLSELYKKLKEENYPELLINLYEYSIDGSNEIKKCDYSFIEQWSKLEPMDLLIKLLSLKHIFLAAQVFVISKDVLNKKGLYFEKNIYYEDNLWLAQVFMRCSNIVLNNQYIFCYRIGRPNSITSNITKKKIYDQIYIIDTVLGEVDNSKYINKRSIYIWVLKIYHQVLNNICQINVTDKKLLMEVNRLSFVLKKGLWTDKFVYMYIKVFKLENFLLLLRCVKKK